MLHAKAKTKAIAAMSGGVDSSVAAALLKKQGFGVEGLFLVLFDEQEAVLPQVKAVADALEIRLRVLDLKKEFEKTIIDGFGRQYEKGLTPNPCVVCNKAVKFGLMLEKALEHGDCMATGHYVRIKAEKSGEKATYSLWRGKDPSKDQTYFLHNLGQKQLKRVLFPLGDYAKADVKEMAGKWQLPVLEKESRDACFMAGKKMRDFLVGRAKMRKGPIVDANTGEQVGRHEGLPLYTIGQRGGMNIGGLGPYYVVRLDVENNILLVSNKDFDPLLYGREMAVEKVNWVSGKEPNLPMRARVQIRYRHPAQLAKIEKKGRGYRVVFDKSQRAITPGQSAVFYRRNQMLGGGIIR